MSPAGKEKAGQEDHPAAVGAMTLVARRSARDGGRLRMPLFLIARRHAHIHDSDAAAIDDLHRLANTFLPICELRHLPEAGSALSARECRQIELGSQHFLADP